jgi:hypothetical protein
MDRGGPPHAEPAGSRRRVVLRRWRLAVRLRQRRLSEWRQRRVRPPLTPSDDQPLLAPAQRRFSRWVGRALLRGSRARRALEYQRSIAWRRVESPRIIRKLVTQQLSLFILAIILVGTTFLGDIVISHYGWTAASRLGVEQLLRDTFAAPSRETIRNLLAASAGATGTILGLVLSISLIVFQATGDRYRSPRVVEFLLQDRLGNAAVQLLALGFLSSLWVLALLEVVQGTEPYLSAGVAVGICSVGVGSLLSYRREALLGYLPEVAAGMLSRDVLRHIGQVADPRRSKRAHSEAGERVRVALQTLDDLVADVLGRDDTTALPRVAGELTNIAIAAFQTAALVESESLFFPRRVVPIKSEHWRSLAMHGLPDPMSTEPDRLFIHRSVVALAEVMRGAPQNNDLNVALWQLRGHALVAAWQSQELEALELYYQEALASCVDPGSFAIGQNAEQVGLVALWMLSQAGDGLGVEPRDIVAERPWEKPKTDIVLPALAKEQALLLRQQVQREKVVAGRVVTPRAAMLREVESRWRLLEVDQVERQQRRAVELILMHARATVDARADGASSAVSQAVKLLLRTLYLGRSPVRVGQLARLLTDVYGLADSEQSRELREDAALAVRRLAEEAHWDETWELLPVVMDMLLAEERRAAPADPPDFTMMFDYLFLLGIVWGWSQYHHRADALEHLVRWLEPPFRNLDGLQSVIGDDRFSSVTTFSLAAGVRWSEWAQPLSTAVYELPDIALRGGGFGYTTRKNHSSALVSKGLDGFGPAYEECLNDLIRAAVDRRAQLRATLGRLVKDLLNR